MILVHKHRTCRCKTTNTGDRIIDSLFLLAGALLRYVSRLFEVSGSTLAYPRFRPPPLGTDALRYCCTRVLQLFQPTDPRHNLSDYSNYSLYRSFNRYDSGKTNNPTFHCFAESSSRNIIANFGTNRRLWIRKSRNSKKFEEHCILLRTLEQRREQVLGRETKDFSEFSIKKKKKKRNKSPEWIDIFFLRMKDA